MTNPRTNIEPADLVGLNEEARMRRKVYENGFAAGWVAACEAAFGILHGTSLPGAYSETNLSEIALKIRSLPVPEVGE